MLLRAAFFFVGVGGSAAFRYCILNSINIQSTRGGVQRFPAHFFTPLLAVTIEDAASEEVPVSDNEGVASSGKQFDWEKQWYPLAVEEFTDKKKSHAMMFLGNNIVLWHDGKKWSVFEDACPHRGVPLSEGRVESNGELLCSYHAWTFNGKGECTSIPQTLTKEKEVSLLPKACVKSYPTQVLQGLIWVWGSKGAPGSDVALQAALKTPHIIDELEDPEVRPRISPLTWTFRDLPYGWDMFMENVADAAHVPVSHHGLTGNRYKDAQPITFKRKIGVTEIPVSDGGKLVPGFEEDAGFKYEMESYRGGKDIRITNDFRPPCLFKTKFENSTMTQFLYATPTKPGYCRFISVAITIKDPKNYTPGRLNGLPPLVPIPKWFLHLFLNLFMVIPLF